MAVQDAGCGLEQSDGNSFFFRGRGVHRKKHIRRWLVSHLFLFFSLFLIFSSSTRVLHCTIAYADKQAIEQRLELPFYVVVETQLTAQTPILARLLFVFLPSSFLSCAGKETKNDVKIVRKEGNKRTDDDSGQGNNLKLNCQEIM